MNEVIKLIKNKNYTEAEKKISKILKTEDLDEKNKIRYYYLIAVISHDFYNPNRDIHKAKRYIKMCLNSKFVAEEYYVLYSKLENDKLILESTVQKGLKKIPRSQFLNQLSFRLKDKEGKIALYQKLKNTSIFKENFILTYVQFFFAEKMWDYLLELETFSKKVKNNTNYIFFLFAIGIAKLMSSSNNDDLIKAKEKLEFILTIDDENILENNLHIFLAYCYKKLDERKKFKELILKLPIAIKYFDLDSFPYSVEMNFSSLYKTMFPEMTKYCAKEKELKRRISVIYALYLFYPSTHFNIIRFSKKNINDIKANKNLFDDYFDYYKSICYMHNLMKEKCESFREFLKCPGDSYDRIEITLNSILSGITNNEIQSLKNDMIDFLEIHYLSNDVAKYVITPFVKACHNLSNYELIYEICNTIGAKNIATYKNDLPLFEMAYSVRNYDILFSKNLYELCLEKEKSHAAFNNLGTIYEELGYLSKASELFNKALKLDEFEVIYKNNCERISKRILKQSQAKSFMANNNFDYLEVLLILSTQRDKYNAINFDNIDTTKFENLTLEDVKHYYNTFLAKGFYIKMNEKVIVDMDLFKILNNLADTINKNKEYKNIANNINYEKLNSIGYNSGLIKNLDKIKDKDLVRILKRDLKECAIAYVAGQYKSTLILGGSIIETILTYILKSNGINKYKFNNNGKENIINLDRMGIDQMLFVANEEKLINYNIYHLDHYVREFRNAIHPSVEIRKKFIINERNASMIWQILMETILTIL